MAQPRPNYKYDQVTRSGINAILLGAPGSGKGTQVWTLILNFNTYTHLLSSWHDCATNYEHHKNDERG